MNILIVNDDGIESKGLSILAKAAAHFGTVYVAVPKTEQSAKSHAISIKGQIEITETNIQLGMLAAILVDGTPVDAIRAGLKVFDVEFDLVLSGINIGANLACDVSYSGTVAAAFEGALAKIPAIAFSAPDIEAPYLYDETVKLLDELIESQLYQHALVLNVNFPKETFRKPVGVKVTILGKRQQYSDLVKVSGQANKYHLTHSIINYIEDEDSDVYAYENGYVSITPLKLDRTDFTAHKKINSL